MFNRYPVVKTDDIFKPYVKRTPGGILRHYLYDNHINKAACCFNDYHINNLREYVELTVLSDNNHYDAMILM